MNFSVLIKRANIHQNYEIIITNKSMKMEMPQQGFYCIIGTFEAVIILSAVSLFEAGRRPL